MILVNKEALSISMSNEQFYLYYDEFYQYLNEKCYVKMVMDENRCTYDEWTCDNVWWRYLSIESDLTGVFYIGKLKKDESPAIR